MCHAFHTHGTAGGKNPGTKKKWILARQKSQLKKNQFRRGKNPARKNQSRHDKNPDTKMNKYRHDRNPGRKKLKSRRGPSGKILARKPKTYRRGTLPGTKKNTSQHQKKKHMAGNPKPGGIPFVYMYLYTYIYIFEHINMCTYTYIHIYIYIYISIHT